MPELQQQMISVSPAYCQAPVADKIIPKGLLEWMLAFFILGLFTVSYVEGLSIVVILYGALLSGVFLIYFLHNRISLHLPPEVIAYFCWICWALGGLVNVIDTKLYVQQLLTIIQMGFLIFMVTVLVTVKKKISTIMLLIGIGSLSVASSGYLSGDFQKASETGVRATGYLANANEFAYAILFSLFAAAFFWGQKKSFWWRIPLSLLIIASFASILFSGSRKGLLTAVLFFFLWWLFSQSRASINKRINKMALLLFLLCGIYMAVDLMMPHTPLGKRLEEKELARGGGDRLALYKEGIDIIQKYPVFGIGLNNSRKLSSTWQYSHSDYIEVASTTGVVGFIFYYSIYVFLWLRLRRLKKMLTAPDILNTFIVLRIAIILILVAGFGTVHIKSKITWLSLATAIGYSWSLDQAVKTYKKKLRHAEGYSPLYDSLK